MHRVDWYFSPTYGDARQRFLAAAALRGARVASFALPVTGAQGEALATDVALLSPPGARRLLLVTSATHGVEGFCGSACQLALLDDAPLLARAADTGVALLLVHAVNPHGFSWWSRTDEANVDLNRNAQAFSAALPDNRAYAELHPLLVPQAWPPTPENRQAIAGYIARHGPRAWRDAVSCGQYTHPGGLFYGGAQRQPSVLTFERVLQTFASGFADIGWIDIHTGLGPRGHGEKIFAGRPDPDEVARAQRWWGCDIALPFAGTSASAAVSGQIGLTIYTACPDSRVTQMALEFGTVPFDTMVDALRGEAWLRAHPDAPAALTGAIRRAVREAFHDDQPDWQGMVLGQSRVALLQALRGLAAGPASQGP